ncbi:MAG: amino acid--tRNA ligase-related protein [Candidatus Nasuia deltocephalinicola]
MIQHFNCFNEYIHLNKFIFLKGWILNLKIHSRYIFFDIFDGFNYFQVISYKCFLKYLNLLSYVILFGLFTIRDFQYNYFLIYGRFELFLFYIYYISLLIYFFNFKKKFLNNFKFKNFIFNVTNFFFYFENFYYIETPLLSRFFSEGSKSYIISERNNNLFHVLSQSPQIFKQFLVIFGFHKYYQFSKCFRYEDLRSDRLEEFIQIDFEFSFLNNFDVLYFIKNFFFYLILKSFKVKTFYDFCIISYKNSFKFFFKDKPDIRNKLIFFDFFILNFYLYFFFKKLNFAYFFNFFFLIGNNFKNYIFFLHIFLIFFF